MRCDVMIDFIEFPPFIFLIDVKREREIDKLKRVYASHHANGSFKMEFNPLLGAIVCLVNATLNTLQNDIKVKWNPFVICS